ncbi:MAG: hypothetical protein IPL71_04930 [Anaerolineales bacterium]|uniref:hypothetical protein n=1 Tax=Candidatus Villigracilis proximus TaxID=3140683 RepID=UPI003136E3D4|nr:hypothetical protein [Anaerolineales bacterium]
MNKCVLKNDFLQIEYLTESQRISGLIPAGKPNMLADLSNLPPIPTPYGNFYFRGGHRLWHSPEALPRTYIPDIGEMIITELPNGVILETQTEPGSGIRKRIEIHLAADKPSVKLIHTLVNDGLWPVELAPWTITQFRLGGAAILPMPVGNVDAAGLLANRQFSFWPYARINDTRLKLGDEFTFFNADAILPPFKMGYFNPHGWMAYWLDGILFRKTFDAHVDSLHPDNNCNSEIYCGDQFVELESLAPLKMLNPGESVDHVETWDLFDGLDSLPGEVQSYLNQK